MDDIKDLVDSDYAVKALEDVEKLILGFDMDVIYTLNSDASYVLAKQILYSYCLLLKEVTKKLISSFEASESKVNDDVMEKSEALSDLLNVYLAMLDSR